MDIDVDPCDNFYEFTCGNYSKKKVLKHPEWQINVFGDQEKLTKVKLLGIIESDQKKDLKVIQKMKIFYQDCVSPGKTDIFNLYRCC